MKEIIIDGQANVPKQEMCSDYKLIRTYSAGVFFAKIEKREGKEAVLRDAIRIWYWEGAYSLSELAVNGTCRPDKCKFAIPVDTIELTEVIEVLSVTEKAKNSILGVPSWTRQ